MVDVVDSNAGDPWCIERERGKKEKLEAEKEVLRRRKEAEDYIMSSGDPEAIKMLMLARANPANYSQVLSGGMNKGNSTLKTAMGVMAGVVVGNMIATAASASALSSALEGAQSRIDGLDVGTVGDGLNVNPVSDGLNLSSISEALDVSSISEGLDSSTIADVADGVGSLFDLF